MPDKIVIDFEKFGGPVYLGREKAQQVRERLRLDEIDNSDRQVLVIIPTKTFSIGSSFFLGLFGESIRHAKTMENFLAKFEFRAPEHIKETIVKSNIQRALFENSHLIRP